jgi:hypothetical protein
VVREAVQPDDTSVSQTAVHDARWWDLVKNAAMQGLGHNDAHSGALSPPGGTYFLYSRSFSSRLGSHARGHRTPPTGPSDRGSDATATSFRPLHA